ncbi:MAG: histidinol-phosphate transaminase [Actinomycetota bacterium]
MGIGRVRPAVQGLAAYRPGKGAAQAEEEHGITDAIKLASNENPYAPVPEVTEAIATAINGANRYGDHRATELRAALAHWLGVTAEQVAVGCGSVGLLQQLCLTYLDPGDEVVYPWLSFEAYPVTAKMMSAVPVTPPLVDHAFDMDAVTAAVTDRTKLVLLATPNNPTGTAISTEQIRKLLTSIPDDVVVLVDEAYREFSDPALGDPVTDLLPHHRNVIVSRTFSKAYGLAGLRAGYAIADPAIVQELDKVLLAFAVNSAAQAGALAAIDAVDKIQVNIDRIKAERTRVVDALTTAGWQLPPAYANFVYLATGEDTDEICVGLERRGVVVRPFSGDGLRVTIGSEAENDRFLATLADLARPNAD